MIDKDSGRIDIHIINRECTKHIINIQQIIMHTLDEFVDGGIG